MLVRTESPSRRTRLVDLALALGLGPARLYAGSSSQPFLVRHRTFALVVLVPTLLTVLYLFGFAANQYVSESQFILRNTQPQMPSLLGQVLGSPQMQQASQETSGIDAYLKSHDAVAALQKRVDLVGMFRRPRFDVLSRLKAHPSAEALLKYYQGQIKVSNEDNNGITTLTVRTFRPDDSMRLSQELLQLGEQMVNNINQRAQADALATARSEVARSETRLLDIGQQLTRFRDQGKSIDPTGTSAMVMQVMGGLEGELARARAELVGEQAYLKPGTPQLVQAQTRVSALERQVATQRDRLAGSANSLAPAVASYDQLMLRRDFANRDYETALSALETARLDAIKQHLYLVRVVEPNRAEKSLYPQRWITLLTVFFSLIAAYGIGWLIVAGVREHAA